MSNAGPNFQTRFMNAVADAFANMPVEINMCPSGARLPLDGFLSYSIIGVGAIKILREY